jgi:thioredoxin 1
MNITELTTETFDAAIASSTKPILVDFWASWCGPCKMLSPVLDQIAEEMADSATIMKVNQEQYPELAVRFGVTALPTLIVFNNGQPTTTITGLKSKAFIQAALTA